VTRDNFFDESSGGRSHGRPPDDEAIGALASTDLDFVRGKGPAETMGWPAGALLSGDFFRQESSTSDMLTAMPQQPAASLAGGDALGGTNGDGAMVGSPVTDLLSPASVAVVSAALGDDFNGHEEEDEEDTYSLEPVENESYYPSGTRRASPTVRARISLHTSAAVGCHEALSPCVPALQASGGDAVRPA
jgi:hypothetical protein